MDSGEETRFLKYTFSVSWGIYSGALVSRGWARAPLPLRGGNPCPVCDSMWEQNLEPVMNGEMIESMWLVQRRAQTDKKGRIGPTTLHKLHCLSFDEQQMRLVCLPLDQQAKFMYL